MKKYQTIDAGTLLERMKLVDLGFTDVLDFEGGVEEWERAGYPMQRSHAAAAA